MAHFAKMNGNVVERVEAVANETATDEEAGVAFLRSLYGEGTEWLQCSYNGNMRGRFPAAGFTYDVVAGVFIAPQPFPSWTLDGNYDWQPPTPYPLELDPDLFLYRWDEPTLSWVLS